MVAQRNITPFPPPSDVAGDELAALVDARIEAKLQRHALRLGTITSVSGDDAQVSVQEWGDDAAGQQLRTRTAGGRLVPGDSVVIGPVPGGEYVVLGKLVNTAAERAVVSSQDVRDNAIAGRHVQTGSIPLNRLNETVPTTTQAHNIATAAANQAVGSANFATVPFVNQQIQTRQPTGNYLTQAALNPQLDTKASVVHTHRAGELTTDGGDDLNFGLRAIRDMAVCAYDNRNKTGNPCGAARNRAKQIN